MPDQPEEQPPLMVAEKEQPVIRPAEPDSHDLPARPQTTGLSRSQLRAAIRSVYRSPHATLELEPENPPAPPEEEVIFQDNAKMKVVEEYSIPAPAEFSPEPKKINNFPGEERHRQFSISNPAEKGPLAPGEQSETAQPENTSSQEGATRTSPEEPAEITNPNRTLAEDPTLSTVDLETYAHAASHAQELKESASARHEDELERAARAQVLIAKARVQARQGQLDLARRLFGQAITEDPTNAEAWTWLGGLLAEVNLERAKVCLSRAVELDATNERARKGLAEVNQRLEDQAHKQEGVAESRAIVLARPEIKIGLEEVIDRQRRSGIELDPESIPLGGAQFGPAIERGELKQSQFGPPRLGKVPVAIGLVVLVGIIVALIWLGPLNHGNSEPPASTGFAGITGQAGANLAAGQVQTQVAEVATLQATPASSDEAFNLKIRLEIDKYNRFFLTARNLRSQIQDGKITWEKYAQSSKQLQADIKAEKKPLDNLAVETTPKLIQFYRELQNIASITSNAMDFTISGIDNTSPEDLEEGNRQFNDAARHLTDLLGLLNQQMPLPGTTPSSNIITPATTLPASVSVPRTTSVTGDRPVVTSPVQPSATPGSSRHTPTPTP